MSDEQTTYYVKDDTSGEFVEASLPDPPGFHDTLPEDLRDNEAFKEIGDPQTLAQKYIEARSKVPVIPGDPNDYLYEFPEGFDVNENDLNGFKQLAHEMGLTQKQYGDALKFQIDRETRMMDAARQDVEAHRSQSEATLKQEWGTQYEQNLELAKQVFRRFADDNIMKMVNDTKFGDNPEVIRLFNRIGKALSEDVLEPVRKRSEDDTPKDELGRPMLKFKSMESK